MESAEQSNGFLRGLLLTTAHNVASIPALARGSATIEYRSRLVSRVTGAFVARFLRSPWLPCLSRIRITCAVL